MKRIFKIGAIVVVLLLVAALALPFLVDANRFRPLLEQQLSSALGRQVAIGDLRLSLLRGGVSASNLTIAEDPAFGQGPFLAAKSLSIGVDLGALIFSQELHVRSVTLDGADVALIQTAEGDWNFSNLGARRQAAPPAVSNTPPAPATPESSLDLSVKVIRVQDSRVSLMQGSGTRELRDLDFELRDFSANAALPFSLSATMGDSGTIRFNGTAGPIAQTNTAETPFDTQIEIKALDLAASPAAKDDSGLGGLLSFNGSVNSNGKSATLKGAATVDRLRLSRAGTASAVPVAVNLALVHDLKTRRGNVARSTVKLGSASATISGNYNLSTPSPTINATFAGSDMPLSELLAFLPVLDIVLPTGAKIEGGKVTAEIASRGTLANLDTTGSVKIENTQLTGYDLGAKLRIVQQLAGLPTGPATNITLAAAGFDMGSSGTRVRDIQFVAPSLGNLTGEGTVSPSHELDFRMSAVVKTGGLLAAAIQQRGETTTVPFFIQGTSANPVFKADVKSLANEKLQQIVKNPEGAVKNAKELVDTAKGILDMFRKAPAKAPEQK
jgi:AsmA protein